MAKLNVILRDSGGNSKAGYRVAVYNESDVLVADTNLGSMVDNGDGSYVSAEDMNPGTYTVKYATTSSGTLAVVPGYEDFSFGAVFDGVAQITDGGTGATTVEGAQENLELRPDYEVQRWNASLQSIADMEIPISGYSFPVIVANDGWYAVDEANTRQYLGVKIGTDVQAHTDSLDELDSAVRNVGSGTTFVTATYNAQVDRGVPEVKTPSEARTILGLGTVAVESTVPVAKGGTGGTSIAAAQTNLNLVPGTDVQEFSIHLDAIVDEADGTGATPSYIAVVEDEFGIRTIDGKKTSDVISDLGIGTAGLEDKTSTGEDDKIPIYNDGLCLPILAADPTPGSDTYGRLYVKATGNATSGSFGLYFIKRYGQSGDWRYAKVTLNETIWTGGGS